MKKYEVKALNKEGNEVKYEIEANNIKEAYLIFNNNYTEEVIDIQEKYEPSSFASYFL